MRAVILRTLCLVLLALPLSAQERLPAAPGIAPARPDAALAAEMLGLEGPVIVTRVAEAPARWAVSAPNGTAQGVIGSSWEIARTLGYSGRPIDMLVAVTPEARIADARLMRHAEPILTLGLSDADIARFVGGFAGVDLAAPEQSAALAEAGAPDIISRATVTTGVIRDSVLRVGRALALAQGYLDAGRINRVGYERKDWQALLEEGAVGRLRVTMAQAAEAMPEAAPPLEPGDGAFIELFAAVIDPPAIGRNILGQQAYTRVVAALPEGKVALFVASRGLYSHRGMAWRRSGLFDRLALVQGGARYPVLSQGYIRIDKLPAGLPEFKERSLFQVGGEGFDPAAPFTLELTATRGPAQMVRGLDYALPEAYQNTPPAEPAPLWRETWERRKWAVIGVATMQGVLTLILLAQEWIVRRPRLWRGLRLSFLTVTLVWLGWGINGQLSVVQVVAFVQSLLSGFRWETFLIEPVIFTLWAGVALGLLFWGRGVFCGWLCPFGALQELTNQIAQRLGVRQIAVPQPLHERLWIIKYTLFLAILALSFYSMQDALVLAEVEPFKTAISMRMMRAWPFVLFVLALLAAGLFIERFYCRYLCPLGAALAIPAKLKIFDWMRRRPQCGRECRLCEPKCTVGAIDPLGRINPNECVLCLRCQVIYFDPNTCPTLKRRARAGQAKAAT
ncbi:NosR/NirI family transcriptional regulator, nitrite reductase regulator [Cribrihabitans marinus]|uniref:NosR/NirI family transcriptional regulator, nitrite reductase regulator n=1 Tax=Cribrihabitans marinus TaxID=1227549 RepID=A0A1H7DU59_9RHOB|nr:NosR/NirI family protein [Cribrihabitans marinus]SEK02820.1 NosR/NirI family transcriptional regulator, nitrite reductase regulator [Cribrihabitans marinus]